MIALVVSFPSFNEPVNVLSHLGGAAVFVVLGIALVGRGRGAPWRTICLAVFAFSCILMLSISGVYHLLDPGGAARLVLRRLDHAAIFTLIAGTFTPIHGILFTGAWRWGALGIVWSAAATGITLQSVFLERMPPWLSVIFYLGLGWLGLVSAYKLFGRHGWRFIAPLFCGGVAYSVGAGLLGLGALTGGLSIVPGVIGRHELFHFAVLAGIGFHWKFVASFASGAPALDCS